MKKSCGALLYTISPQGKFGLVLGLEKGHWLPFKGCAKESESNEEAAIREIKEETCGLLKIKRIKLNYKYTSKKKQYFIGLCYIPYDYISKFSIHREEKENNDEYTDYVEKEEIKFFEYNGNTINSLHNLSNRIIIFYKRTLDILKNKYENEYNKVLLRHKVASRISNYIDKFKKHSKDKIERFTAIIHSL